MSHVEIITFLESHTLPFRTLKAGVVVLIIIDNLHQTIVTTHLRCHEIFITMSMTIIVVTLVGVAVAIWYENNKFGDIDYEPPDCDDDA